MKRSILLIALFGVLLSSPVWAWGVMGVAGGSAAAGGLTCTTSDDSEIYSHTGHTNETSYFSSTRYKGIPFTISATTRITSVTLWLANASGSEKNTICRIETISGGVPTNTLADVNASRTVSIPAAAGTTYEFAFDTPFSLSAGTYVVVLRGDAETGSTAGMDSEEGHFYYTTDSGANWADDTNANGYLVIYGCQ